MLFLSRMNKRLIAIALFFTVSASAVAKDTVFVSAWFQPGNFRGYHFLVFEGGKAAQESLFLTKMSDRVFLKRLQALGARPGNNLLMEAWSERNNPHSSAPDSRVAGSFVQVRVRFSGQKEWVWANELFENQKKEAMIFRFGGNARLIPVWKSGCIVCLYSCPGSKVGNASFTIRNFVHKPNRFRLKRKYTRFGKRQALIRFDLLKKGS